MSTDTTGTDVAFKSEGAEVVGPLLSVARAAKLVGVHPSTIRRWIEHGKLPAYRVGERRVGVRPADLGALVTPLYRRHEETTGLSAAQLEVRPLTKREQRLGLEALEEAERLQDELLAQRGGALFPSSADLINQGRDERTRELTW